MNIIEVEHEIRGMFFGSAISLKEYPNIILLRDDILIQIVDRLASIRVVEIPGQSESPAYNQVYIPSPQRQQQQQQQQMERDVSGKFHISKPANIIINWRSFITNLPENTLTLVGATTSKWLLFLAALVLCKKLFDLKYIDISDTHAAIMLTLATECGFDRTMDEEQLLFAVRLLLRIEKGVDLEKMSLSKAVDDLVTFQSIAILDGNIRLVETVSRDALDKSLST
ncbi:hypothetical protein [Rhizobium leguminosarum]|uniref:hypothetical protein n=1 Tax=Rhizobium leguminosarum TaxID=384 RepID=UPI001C98C1DB|nr:hypothetical protein [Rhizobium leguminosarum]MBY5516203.1 hypothetical protein [Rhizobium leguminosarum]